MKKQNAMQRFIGRLTGSHELEQAEQMLGGLLLAAGDDGQRREIGRIRKLIRKYRRERRTRLCIAGGALCIVLAALILWMATVMSEKGTADKSGVQKSASAPDRKNASALPEVGIQDVLLGEGQSAPPAQTEKQEETEEIVKLEEPVELLLSFTGDCILGTDEYFAWDTGFNAYYDMYLSLIHI